jgi:hypothetical protein
MIPLEPTWWEDRGMVLNTVGGLNIFAIRSFPIQANKFNDLLFTARWLGPSKGGWQIRSFKITTLPGEYWLVNLLNPKGTALLKPGQYVDAYELGFHKGKAALVQVGPVTVYRDRNQDLSYDFEAEETGLFGINIHQAGRLSHLVNSWSAGCQVFKEAAQFELFLESCRETKQQKFTYTLFDERDFQSWRK